AFQRFDDKLGGVGAKPVGARHFKPSVLCVKAFTRAAVSRGKVWDLTPDQSCCRGHGETTTQRAW
ncbi:hypothetical protein WMY93_033473, partial [Mugilogobius chulae]